MDSSWLQIIVLVLVVLMVLGASYMFESLRRRVQRLEDKVMPLQERVTDLSAKRSGGASRAPGAVPAQSAPIDVEPSAD